MCGGGIWPPLTHIEYGGDWQGTRSRGLGPRAKRAQGSLSGEAQHQKRWVACLLARAQHGRTKAAGVALAVQGSALSLVEAAFPHCSTARPKPLVPRRICRMHMRVHALSRSLNSQGRTVSARPDMALHTLNPFSPSTTP